MAEYVLINQITKKPVQYWTFTDWKGIVYCKTLEWAMKLPSEESANRILESLKNHFPKQTLKVCRITKKISFQIG